MFTDVEGSTRLLAALGERYVAVHGQQQAIVRTAVAHHDGFEISTEGDGFFVVFGDARLAARAAAEMTATIEQHPWPEDGRVRIRIGMHTGRAVIAADDYVGIDVNRAARIAAAAHGGQILLSGTTASLVSDIANELGSIRDLGRHRLKDVGIEQLYRLEPAGLEADDRAPRSLDAAPSNLPASPQALVDRVADREQLTHLLGEARVVTVTGAGGIGKTALALDVANAARSRFIDGTGYVDLAAIDDVETAAVMIAEGLGLQLDPGRTAAEVLADQLRAREALLVFETAEHLPAIRDLIATLVHTCPRIRVLVTSRATLHVRAERELRLEPLSIDSATELFISRARTVRPTFQPTSDEAAAIATLAERLDGLPLAIELAAARTRVLSPPQILERLEKQLPVLSGGAVDAPLRQQTLRSTVEWSYQQLSEPEKALLQTTAVFAGDFGLDAAENLAQHVERDIPSAAVLDLLEGLIDKSLIDARGAGRARFRLLAAIREFALEELADAGQLAATRAAHLAWISGVARTSAAAIDSGDEHLRAYEDDLRAALGTALETPERTTDALELAAAAGTFWYKFGRAREGSVWLERALASAPPGRDTVHADALYWAGVLADERRQPERAVACLELSLEIRRELGEVSWVARTINSLGVVSRTAGDLGRARELLTEGLELKRVAGDPLTGSTLTNLAIVAADEEHFDEAFDLFEAALEADRRAGSVDPHPAVLLGIAVVQVRMGQADRAIEPALAAARRFVLLDDDLSVAECLEVLVEAWQRGHPEAALALLHASDRIREAEGIARNERDQQRLQAIGMAISAGLSADDVKSLVAEDGALDAIAAVDYAEAITTAQPPGRRAAR